MKIYILSTDHRPGGLDLDKELQAIPKVSITGLVSQADIVIAILGSLPPGGTMHILTLVQREIPVWCFYENGADIQENIKKQLQRQRDEGKTTLQLFPYDNVSEIPALIKVSVQSGGSILRAV